MRRKQVGKGEGIRNPGAVLIAMGDCRDVLIRAGDEVRPFGVSFHALQMVIRSIDTLAYYLTGQPSYYSIEGTTGPSAARPTET